MRSKKTYLIPVVTALALTAFAWQGARGAEWRSATDKELAALIPARVPVEKERIETELRTAAGITNGQGRYIAGVVMITAGYSAEGKYSHFLLVQVPVEIAGVTFRPGDYVFGSKRLDDGTLEVSFYDAATGRSMVVVKAKKDSAKGPIRSLQITPPENRKGVIRIGRFAFDYSLAG
jgi:hypothetical protein